MFTLCEVCCYVPSYWELFKSRQWEWIVREGAVSFIDGIHTAWGCRIPPFTRGWVQCNTQGGFSWDAFLPKSHLEIWGKDSQEVVCCKFCLRRSYKPALGKTDVHEGFPAGLRAWKGSYFHKSFVNPEARFRFNMLSLCQFARSETRTGCPLWGKRTVKIIILD